ncbi:MAG: SRPBCC family protein [Planctomycetota bacterium]
MDFSNPFGIEYRVVNEIEHNGQSARVVSGARNYSTSIDDLWDAITNEERLPRWFLPISGDLQVGGRYQLKGNAGGEIQRCDPPEKLEVTWEYGGNVSWVHVTLATESVGTRLTLEHIMSKDAASEEHWKKFGPGATGVGWDLGFMGLGKHLETGEAVVQEESHAWMGSDEGKAFIRSCATGWAEAHIRSGESAGTANAVAEATAKAYCGE